MLPHLGKHPGHHFLGLGTPAGPSKQEIEPTAAAVDIRADYVAKNGAPTAAAPKIFFRYYYVNSSTGEKSCTMLGGVERGCSWRRAIVFLPDLRTKSEKNFLPSFQGAGFFCGV